MCFFQDNLNQHTHRVTFRCFCITIKTNTDCLVVIFIDNRENVIPSFTCLSISCSQGRLFSRDKICDWNYKTGIGCSWSHDRCFHHLDETSCVCRVIINCTSIGRIFYPNSLNKATVLIYNLCQTLDVVCSNSSIVIHCTW